MKKVLRKIGITLAVIGGILVVAVVGMYFYSNSQLNQEHTFASESIIIPTDAESIENGKKWVQATCVGCHTADLSGKTMINEPPIGQVDTANLTSGAGGIGSTYSDEDWVRALRHGVGQDGKPLLIMPSSAYWNFTDEDLGEIIAYLKTIPPVDHETKVDLDFIGTIALANDPTVLHVNLIEHNTRPTETTVGTTLEYGQYLVNVSGCRDCHGTDLSGLPAMHGNLPAPNITSGSPLQTWTVEDFINTMRTGVTPSGHVLVPDQMPWQGYNNYSDNELTAIYLYLQSVPYIPKTK